MARRASWNRARWLSGEPMRMGNGWFPCLGISSANGSIYLFRSGWRAAGIIGSLRDCHTWLLA